MSQAAQTRTQLAFRYAACGDVAAIVALVQSAYRGEASRAGWTTEADFLDGQRIDAGGVTEMIAKPDGIVLLGEQDAQLVACAQLDRSDTRAYFGMFAVDPARQGGGFGDALLAEAERIAREQWHCDELGMTVITLRDELIAWYQRRGYRRSGVFKPFPYGDERFGVPKRDDLRFEVLSKRWHDARIGESSS